jgi:hypothetical protein
MSSPSSLQASAWSRETDSGADVDQGYRPAAARSGRLTGGGVEQGDQQRAE